MSDAILNVQGVSIAFGGLKAVSEVSIQLRPGGLQGLIGPNGAGKTTVFNLLTGVYQPDSGTISLGGRVLNGLKPSRIAAAGMARTFQNIRLFPDLSVLDNVRVACHLRRRTSVLDTLFRSQAWRGEEAAMTELARELLDIFGLLPNESWLARELPYGKQRRLEIARALALDPKVLLLDEPAAGMNPSEKVELKQLIRQVRDQFGLSILLIEHDMGLVMDICERVTVLDHGEVIADGVPDAIQQDPKVIEAYLGAPGAHL